MTTPHAHWLADAASRDDADPLREYRDQFSIPAKNGSSVRYFCGNSLGLQPHSAALAVTHELEKWGSLGVDGHFEPPFPWFRYHEACRDGAAHIVGAKSHEVVVMNSLTANLHLLLVSFFRPTAKRFKILIDAPTFPSDLYLVQSQLQFHGLDPTSALEIIAPAPDGTTIDLSEIDHRIDSLGESLALALFSGVNFATGQFYDLRRITDRCHKHGALAGFDLAHAAGNVPLALHEWNVDFAAWCNYKYLNSGPGALAGAFVHERHCQDFSLPRFAGWWGNDPATRFNMPAHFVPVASADAWQLSNPPILALAPVRASYDIFQRVGMSALRAKSLLLSDFLDTLLSQAALPGCRVLTPTDPQRRGCQVSIALDRDVEAIADALHSRAIVVDVRKPNIIRVAPTPLYNSFEDLAVFVRNLEEVIHELR